MGVVNLLVSNALRLSLLFNKSSDPLDNHNCGVAAMSQDLKRSQSKWMSQLLAFGSATHRGIWGKVTSLSIFAPSARSEGGRTVNLSPFNIRWYE